MPELAALLKKLDEQARAALETGHLLLAFKALRAKTDVMVAAGLLPSRKGPA